jgi:hypothetical protein
LGHILLLDVLAKISQPHFATVCRSAAGEQVRRSPCRSRPKYIIFVYVKVSFLTVKSTFGSIKMEEKTTEIPFTAIVPLS